MNCITYFRKIHSIQGGDDSFPLTFEMTIVTGFKHSEVLHAHGNSDFFYIILCIHGVIRWYIHGKVDGKRYPSIINVDIHLLYVEYICQIYFYLQVGGWVGNRYPEGR